MAVNAFLPVGSVLYDVITCIHTLEHIEHPGRILYRLRDAASYQSTVLLIEVPHAILSPAGPNLAHPCLFTPESLAPLLKRCGWRPIWMLPHYGTAATSPLPCNILTLCVADIGDPPSWIAPDYERLINEFLLAYQVQTGKAAETKR